MIRAPIQSGDRYASGLEDQFAPGRPKQSIRRRWDLDLLISQDSPLMVHLGSRGLLRVIKVQVSSDLLIRSLHGSHWF